MKPIVRSGWTERVYSTLLFLYPRDFRHEYGADMVQLMRDQCNDEPSLRVYGRASVDLLISIPTQHMENQMNRQASHLVPLVYTAIAAAGLLFALVGGTNPAMLVIGLAIAVLAGTAAGMAWKRAQPIAGRITTDKWWKFVVAGPCIVALVIAGGAAGIEAWFAGVLAVMTAAALTLIGVGLGLARLTGRGTPAARG